MGTFAETANVDYRLSFDDQGNKLPFPLQQINGSLTFPFVTKNGGCRFPLAFF
jgi:hypothetical protein